MRNGDGMMEKKLAEGREYIGIAQVNGPLVFVKGIHNVGYNELAEIVDSKGHVRLGMVLEASDGAAVIQVFEGTSGLSIPDTRVRFRGEPLTFGVGKEILGRVFDGLGAPIDGGPPPMIEEMVDVNGLPINPTAREYPRKCIQTGISAIDGMNALVRGQKLPIFSGTGLPHNKIAAQITRQAKITGENVQFAIVFAAMGIKHDVARYFVSNFEASGVLEKVVFFLNLADDPSVERIVTPRVALTAAEYLAFRENMHVLVILTDMSNYCESLREISTVREEIPTPQGISRLPLQRPLEHLRARRDGEGLHGIDHPDAHPHDAERRHIPSRPRPLGLHHRGADRARARARPAGHLPADRGAALALPAHEGRDRRGDDPRRPRARREPALRGVLAREGRAGARRRHRRGGAHAARQQRTSISATASSASS